MKIATMVRGMLPAPRPEDMLYSPLDIAITLSEKLTDKGHRVTYYGPQGSHLQVTDVKTSNLHPFIHGEEDLQELTGSTDLFKMYIPSLYDDILVSEMFKRAAEGEYDLLHFHHFEAALPFARLYPQVPVVYTVHDPIDSWRREVIEAYLSPNQHFISISNNQRQGAPDLPYAATVYNGIDTSFFLPNGKAEDYLLYVGRIVPEKGVREAVQIAMHSDSRLYIIGNVRPSEEWYFDMHIKPYLSDKILFLGYMERKQLVKYYQKARALLMPVQWEEPFGLSMAESMSCGTPIVAMRRGSIPEVVVDGKTGFIAGGIGEMAEALHKIDTIKRTDCRAHVVENFSINHMVEGYENVFQEIIASNKLGNLQRSITRTVKKATRPIKTTHKAIVQKKK